MKLIRGLHNLHRISAPMALTIGNFDGVHLGHQSLLRRLVEVAKVKQLVSTVMFFEPHPQELFQGSTAPSRLSRLHEKIEAFDAMGIEQAVLVKFDKAFSQMTAEDFIDKLLVEQLGTEHLIIGDDFRFGRQRQGDYLLLESKAAEFDFVLENSDTIISENERISSTRIRKALQEHRLEVAESLLGRAYSISGKVFHGDKRGRTIGFPTANIAMLRPVCPLSGVYLVKARGVSDETHWGVANVGKRPTVNGQRLQLEVHLFDFQGDLYGKRLKVDIISHLREEQRFESLEALTQQINQDVARARELIQTLNQ